jgi:glutathione S-transferase
VALEKREQKSENYLTINPYGRVPAIVDEDVDGSPFALSESVAILRYLVDRHGLHEWYPAGLRERAAADQWLEYASQQASRPFLDLAWLRVLAPRFGMAQEPDVVRVQEEAALKKLHRELPVLQSRLAESPYLAGMRPTLADVALYPFAALHVDAGIELIKAAPAVVAWLDRLAAQSWRKD